MEKVVQKQKEFDVTILTLQEPIITLQLEKDDLQHDERQVSVRIDDVTVE